MPLLLLCCGCMPAVLTNVVLFVLLPCAGVICREVRQSLVDMEEFFDILKTQNSLPSGTIPLPDIPPSLASKFPTAATAAPLTNGSATAAALDHDAAVLQERLLSHSQASSSSNGHSSNGTSAGGNGLSSGSMHVDQQDLVEAALLLEEQQHPQHSQQQHHNLGSSSYDVAMPDRSVAISGLGLEVELEDVRFGYQPERQVGDSTGRQRSFYCSVLKGSVAFKTRLAFLQPALEQDGAVQPEGVSVVQRSHTWGPPAHASAFLLVLRICCCAGAEGGWYTHQTRGVSCCSRRQRQRQVDHPEADNSAV